MPGQTSVDRVIVFAVALLTAVFALGAFSMLSAPAFADDGKRDDTGVELVAKDDDDDGDDDDGSDDGGDTRGDSADSESNSRTGTTRGTGPSHSKSNTSGAR
jgi:hypothetical protein